MEGALPRGWGWWQCCDTGAHGCVLKARQRLLRWKGCYKINQMGLDGEGWIRKRRWRHCLPGGGKPLWELLTQRESKRQAALVKEGHEIELYETAVKWSKPLVLINGHLATKKLKPPPGTEIPGAVLFPTELRAAVALVWGDGHHCWGPGSWRESPSGSQKLNRERKDGPSQTRNN